MPTDLEAERKALAKQRREIEREREALKRERRDLDRDRDKKKKKKRSRHDDDEPRKRHLSEAAPLPSLATYAPPPLYRDQVQSTNFQQALQRFTQPPPVPQKFGGHEQANYLRCGVCGADCSGEAAFKQHIA